LPKLAKLKPEHQDQLFYLVKPLVWIYYLLIKTNCINCNIKTANANCLCSTCYLELNVTPEFQLKHHQKIYYACLYDDLIRSLLISYKFNHHINLCILLANLAIQIINYFNLTPQYLVFIPSNNIRYIKKGFNHNLEICTIIAKKLGITLIPNYFIKTKYTKPQSSLPKSKRQHNLSKSFAINKQYANLTYSNLLVFDDIMTTGSTFKIINKLIKKSKSNYCFICIAASSDT